MESIETFGNNDRQSRQAYQRLFLVIWKRQYVLKLMNCFSGNGMSSAEHVNICMYILVTGVCWMSDANLISVSACIVALHVHVYIRCHDRWIYLDCWLCLAVVSRWVHCIGRDSECIHAATQGFTASMVYSYCYDCLWLYSFVCHCCICVMLLNV